MYAHSVGHSVGPSELIRNSSTLTNVRGQLTAQLLEDICLYLKKNPVSIGFGAGWWGSTYVHNLTERVVYTRRVISRGGPVALQSREGGRWCVGGLARMQRRGL